MSAAATLAALEHEGYVLALEGGRLKVRGNAPPPPELGREIVEHRDLLKAAVLLSNPPAWLRRLLGLCAGGYETEVRRTIPKDATTQARLDFGEAEAPHLAHPENLRGGRMVKCRVRVRPKQVAAACCTEIGLSPLEWRRILPEVEPVVRDALKHDLGEH